MSPGILWDPFQCSNTTRLDFGTSNIKVNPHTFSVPRGALLCLLYYYQRRRKERISTPYTPSFSSPLKNSRVWPNWISLLSLNQLGFGGMNNESEREHSKKPTKHFFKKRFVGKENDVRMANTPCTWLCRIGIFMKTGELPVPWPNTPCLFMEVVIALFLIFPKLGQRVAPDTGSRKNKAKRDYTQAICVKCCLHRETSGIVLSLGQPLSLNRWKHLSAVYIDSLFFWLDFGDALRVMK